MAFNVLTNKMSVLAPGAPALRASLPSRHVARSRAPFTVCGAVKPSKDERTPASKLALPFAGALAAALILGAALPEDALAARCVLLRNNQRPFGLLNLLRGALVRVLRALFGLRKGQHILGAS